MGRRDNHLRHFIGPKGMIELLSDVHVGPIHDPQGKSPIEIADHVSWAETFRRLHVPYYEEARRYFRDANDDGFYDGVNEIWPYTEDHLLEVIDRYGPSPEESDT